MQASNYRSTACALVTSALILAPEQPWPVHRS